MADKRKSTNLPSKAEIKEHSKKEEPKKTLWVQVRLFPIWLRILLVLAVIVVAAMLGVMVGYGIIGDGEPKDALRWSTWRHIWDIMSGRT
ncbi:MAG TPA: DNA-directed RNA polymerase subunit beta [Planococcus sp. (in: firmicutes)]|nr:DNA-directed RNA polymerase subunit beta [Planococcus sp. (in: firmicutes)]